MVVILATDGLRLLGGRGVKAKISAFAEVICSLSFLSFQTGRIPAANKVDPTNHTKNTTYEIVVFSRKWLTSRRERHHY